MKLKYQFEWVNIDDQIIAVPLEENDQSFHGVLYVNETTQMIMELLGNDTNESKIITALAKDYPEMSVEKIQEYVLKTITILKDHDLLWE